MKLTAMLAAMAAFTILTGCDSPAPGLLSVEPAVTSADTAIDNALLGAWQEEGDNDLVALIRPGDSGGYRISVVSGSEAMNFQAQLFRVNQAEFLDMVLADESDFRINGHAIVRLWINGASLQWAFLDSDWLKQQAAALPAHSGEGKMQLFAPTASVRAFIAANGADDKAHGQIAAWQRLQ
jgi:hypothetical protein